MPSNNLILCRPLLLPPSIFPSIRVFFSEFGSSHQVARLLEVQYQFFQWIFRVYFLYDWLVWSLCCPGDSQESSPALQFKSISSLALSLLYAPTLISTHDYWKSHSFHCMDLCQPSDNLCFLIYCLGFVMAFLPRSKHLLILWLQLPSTVILKPKKIKPITASTFSPSVCLEVIGQHDTILVFWMLSSVPAFSLFSFTLLKRLFSSSLLSAIRVVWSAYLKLFIFLLEILILLVIHPAQHFAWCTLRRS